MASDAASDARLVDQVMVSVSPNDLALRRDIDSRVTLPSTEEVFASPMDTEESFRTEFNDDRLNDDRLNDDRRAATMVPSSLTPPPSTQLAAPDETTRQTFSPSRQQSALRSPPLTIFQTLRDRALATEYAPPMPRQVLNASADELRLMLQACIAEQQKLKMETAHHKLQYNLLSLQSEDDAKRSIVEHEMMRREVDALRMAEHSRQARRELSSTTDPAQAKYLQMKLWYEAAMEENESLHRRLKVAKKLIQQKEEETIHMAEERDMLLTRIRENREHFHMLCSPGGIFHSALTPTQESLSSSSSSMPQQHRAPYHGAPDHYRHRTHDTHARASRTMQREEDDMGRERERERQREREREGDRARERAREDINGHEHGLSALLQAVSQSQSQSQDQDQDQNASAPSTPATSHRSSQNKYSGRHGHHRNAQSMSSLPTTPLHRSRDGGRDGGLLPSVNLLPQTEPPPPPRHQYTQQKFMPTTPNSARDRRRRSRESTISVDDNEELARQALQSVERFPSLAAHHATAHIPSEESCPSRRNECECEDDDRDEGVLDSQDAAQLLRRHAPGRRSLETGHLTISRDASPRPAEQSIRLQAKLLSNAHPRTMAGAEDVREHGTSAKRLRTAGFSDERRVGLGIQYGGLDA